MMDRSGSPVGKLSGSRTRSFDPAAIDEHFIAHDLNQNLAVATLSDVPRHTGGGQWRFVAVFVNPQQHFLERGSVHVRTSWGVGMGCSEPAPDAAQPFRTALEARLVELTEFVVHGLLLAKAVILYSISGKPCFLS